MSVPATTHVWRGLAIASVIVFAYATVLIKLSRDWWHDENYSHGLLIPFIIGYIIWLQRDKFAEVKSNPSTVLGGMAVLGGLFGLWAGVAGAELYTQRLSLVLLLAGTVVYFWLQLSPAPSLVKAGYPDYAAKVGRAVAAGEFDRGILVCGTGIGMAIAANKIAGVRAAPVVDLESARLARSHNNANVLAIGARVTPPERALDLVRTFFKTDFEGGRHERRLQKVAALEQGAAAATRTGA